MKAADLRAVLMLRAVEPALAQAGAAGHDGADVIERAGQQARREVGEQGDPQDWLAARARLALARLGEQHPAWRPVLAVATAGAGAGWSWVVPALAMLVGALGEHLGGSQLINLLAPPLLGLLAWNLGVYLLLLAHALPPWRDVPSSDGPLRRAVLVLVLRGQTRLAVAGAALDAPRAAALARFQRDWLQLSAPWQAARGTALLHAAAAALALGALASWYARGLVLDYRAGWDSTFLDAGQVRALLGWVLGPAAALTGQPLPDAAELAGLRVAQGGGESAARWIHWWSLTILLAVVLPRLALAAAAALRARRLRGGMPLPDDDDLRRLLRAASGRRLTLRVLPYSYRLDPAREAALRQWLDRQFGPGVQAVLQPSLPMGAEDALDRHLAPALPDSLVVLFALTATPEADSHGAFLRALAAQRGARATPPEVLVDESGFRRQLAGPMLDERLAQRRTAWRALLATVGATPRFIELGADPKAS